MHVRKKFGKGAERKRAAKLLRKRTAKRQDDGYMPREFLRAERYRRWDNKQRGYKLVRAIKGETYYEQVVVHV